MATMMMRRRERSWSRNSSPGMMCRKKSLMITFILCLDSYLKLLNMIQSLEETWVSITFVPTHLLFIISLFLLIPCSFEENVLSDLVNRDGEPLYVGQLHFKKCKKKFTDFVKPHDLKASLCLLSYHFLEKHSVPEEKSFCLTVQY